MSSDQRRRIAIIGEGDFIEQSLTEYFRFQGTANVFSFHDMGLDPTQFHDVIPFFRKHNVEDVVLSSVHSGGIIYNQEHPAELIYDNLRAQLQVIDAAYQHHARRLIFVGSSCMYPRDCAQPMQEEQILTGAFEHTSASYAVAKIAGMQMGEAYRQQYGFDVITLIPATVYGQRDHEGNQNHVVGALVQKMVAAKTNDDAHVTLWGTGNPRREFIHIDDFVRAVDVVLHDKMPSQRINVGVGEDVSIRDLAHLIKELVGYRGDIIFDETKADGAPQKLLDSSRINKMGWSPQVSLREGIQSLLMKECS